MRRLLYVSAASRRITDADLQNILDASRRNNPVLGVTGILLYIDLGFLQVLEGPVEHLSTVYKKILGDTRHTRQRVLMDDPADERLFAGWSMDFERPSPSRAGDADVFTATRDAIASAVPHDKAVHISRMLHNFYVVNAGNFA